MKITKKEPRFNIMDEEFQDLEFDIYADDWDDEEGIDSMGMTPSEVGFLHGFKKFN